MKITSHSSEETKKLAGKILNQFKAGGILGLKGDLGAGKTVFVQGLAKELGLKNKIQSPTFILMKIYPLKKPWKSIKTLVHVDAYRFKNANQLYEIGFLDYAERKDALIVVEWIDKVPELKKHPHYRQVAFKFGKKEDERIIVFKS